MYEPQGSTSKLRTDRVRQSGDSTQKGTSSIDTSTGNHDPLVLQGVSGTWSLVATPGLRGDSGFAAISAIRGGGFWTVGVTVVGKEQLLDLD